MKSGSLSLPRMLTCTLASVLVLYGLACRSNSSVESPVDCSDSPLLQTVREEGSIRVIVQLVGDFVPEAELDETEVAAQRQRIAELQDQILAALAGTEVQVLQRFQELPMLVLVVDEPGLCYLLNSDLVQSVEHDVAEPPTG